MKAASRYSRTVSVSPRTRLYVFLALMCCAAFGLSIAHGGFDAVLPALAADSARPGALIARKQRAPMPSRADYARQEPSGAFGTRLSGEEDGTAFTHTGLIAQKSDSAQERQTQPVQPASGFRAFVRKNRTVIVISLAAVGIALTVADTLYVIKTRRDN